MTYLCYSCQQGLLPVHLMKTEGFTHIQLSPQLIQTLVGENNLSAPLDGQTIDEVKYRQVFTFEDVVNYINGQGA